jgi:NADH pyrophosphatase NudC (nudix superfamily)
MGEDMNRRTAEPQNIEVKNITLLLSKTSAVRNSLFDIRYSKYKRGGIPQGRSEIINHTWTGLEDQVSMLNKHMANYSVMCTNQ